MYQDPIWGPVIIKLTNVFPAQLLSQRCEGYSTRL